MSFPTGSDSAPTALRGGDDGGARFPDDGRSGATTAVERFTGEDGNGHAPSTRELLALVATRSHDVEHPAELERRERRFVRWLLASLVAVLAILLTVLWWLDPVSATGRTTRFSVVENGGVRQAKLDLMDHLAQPPDVLVLGSSRSMKLDPATIERVSGGATAFNGGVSGGTTEDIYLYARYADQLWGGDRGRFPHLVIGVVNDVFRPTGTAERDPRLRRFLPHEDTGGGAPLDVAQALLQWRTLQAAWRGVRPVVRHYGASALLHPTKDARDANAVIAREGRQKGNKTGSFDARGMQTFDPVKDVTVPLAQRVRVQMTDYVARTYTADPAYDGHTDYGVDLLRKTIRLANRGGDVPTLWVTPFQPSARRYLPDDYPARDRRFRETIRALQHDPTLQFRFVDLDDLATFGGTPDDFYDGIHMTPANTARVIAYLQAKGLLAPARR